MQIIKNSKIPKGVIKSAVFCTADFDSVCKRIGARPEIRYITYPKKLEMPKERYRLVGIQMNNERYANILKMDSDPYFEFWLQRKGFGYYLEDVEEVRKFLNVDINDVILYDDGFNWIQPEGDVDPIQFTKITVALAVKLGWQKG